MLAYGTEQGEVLVDPTSGKWIPIAHGLMKHSVDLMKDACLKIERTTRGMAGCYAKAIDLLELGKNRCYCHPRKVIGESRSACAE